ncbi:MAG: iron ABC transporter permease [Clostridia bacterium]|nr:iron ABC transporter permease [Clostridia bacterium]
MKLPSSRKLNLRFLILALLFLAALFFSVLAGRFSLSSRQLFRLLASRVFPIRKTWSNAAENVVFGIRLPRVMKAAVIGAALSVAGVSYQGMFRNPLVSPDLLGASTGAGFGAALAILLGAGSVMISATAFFFGLLSVLVAYLVSRASRVGETLSMILAGMIVSALFSAGTSYLKLIADTERKLPEITYWLMGSLSSLRQREELMFLLIPFVLGSVPLFVLRWRINLLTLPDSEAKTMGVNTKALRLIVVVCATLLTSASVAVSGLIGWVGLVVPHMSRMLFGYDYRRLLPATALFGATFLVLVDDISRLASTAEIPIGILTAVVGAPLFLYLLVSGGARRAD